MHTAPADGLAKVIGLAPFDNEVASGRHFDSSDKAHRVSKKQASAGVTGAQSLPLRNEPRDELLEEAAAMAEAAAGAGLDYWDY